VKGYDVVTAPNGEEGLKRLAADHPDLVLLDVMMPGMNGYEVCRAIRADTANGILPVVMVTSLDPTQERIKGLEAGADDFLTKPINQPELLARVRSLLRIKDLYDQLGALNASLEQRVAEQVKEIERFGRLKRFVSPRIGELILAGEVDDPLKTHRREITVVFTTCVASRHSARPQSPRRRWMSCVRTMPKSAASVIAHEERSSTSRATG
jgi:CheY-like chemotaxis protein